MPQPVRMLAIMRERGFAAKFLHSPAPPPRRVRRVPSGYHKPAERKVRRATIMNFLRGLDAAAGKCYNSKTEIVFLLPFFEHFWRRRVWQNKWRGAPRRIALAVLVLSDGTGRAGAGRFGRDGDLPRAPDRQQRF